MPNLIQLKPTIVWIYGRGSGKATLAHETFHGQAYYFSGTPRVWQNYKEEKEVIIDDLMSYPMEELVALFSGVGAPLQIKAQSIIVLSVLHPTVLYKKYSESLMDLMENIDILLRIRPDGTEVYEKDITQEECVLLGVS